LSLSFVHLDVHSNFRCSRHAAGRGLGGGGEAGRHAALALTDTDGL
jgi:hypothetical protein